MSIGGGTQALSETFEYDGLNRVTKSQVHQAAAKAQPLKTYAYDALGNITDKDCEGLYANDPGGNIADKHCLGAYTYAANDAGPHGVTSVDGFNYEYDANGNHIFKKDGGGATVRSLTWTSFNKPLVIAKGGSSVEFAYDAEHSRVMQTTDTSDKIIYIAGPVRFEHEKKAGGQHVYTHYLSAGGGTFGILKSNGTGTNGMTPTGLSTATYIHRDHLGSVTMLTHSSGGNPVALNEKYSYDVWGQRRNTDWTDSATQIVANETIRGFTGHEMLDTVGLVHMNGRVYDPLLGRMLSADPHVPSAVNPQAFNRYSYVLNNPLSCTDPSGFFFKKLFKGIGKVFKGVFKAFKKIFKFISKIPVLRQVAPILAGIACGPAGAVCAGVVGGGLAAAQGGSIFEIFASAYLSATGYGRYFDINDGWDYAQIFHDGVINELKDDERENKPETVSDLVDMNAVAQNVTIASTTGAHKFGNGVARNRPTGRNNTSRATRPAPRAPQIPHYYRVVTNLTVDFATHIHKLRELLSKHAVPFVVNPVQGLNYGWGQPIFHSIVKTEHGWVWVNQTGDGHIFHDGQVWHRIGRLPNGEAFLESIGFGHNYSWIRARFNESFGTELFEDIHNTIWYGIGNSGNPPYLRIPSSLP